jgi:hypothetical protein
VAAESTEKSNHDSVREGVKLNAVTARTFTISAVIRTARS